MFTWFIVRVCVYICIFGHLENVEGKQSDIVNDSRFLLSIKFNIVSVVGTWAFVWNQGFWLSRPLMKMIDLQKMTVKKNLHQMIIVSKYVYIVHILARFFCDLFEVGYLAYQSRRAYGKQIFCAWYWCYKINNDQLYTAFAASVFLRLSIYLLPSYVNQNCML